jgi:outer membrane protein
MTRLFLAILAFAFLLTEMIVPATAQSIPGVAVIDVQRVMRESSAGKSLQAQLEKQRGVYSQQLSKQENELRKLEQDLKQQRSLVSPEAFAERRRQYEQKAGNLQQEVQNRKREFDKMQAGAMRTMETALGEIVQQIAAERKLALVLPKNVVIMHTGELEVTDEVMKRLNAKLPSVKVAAPGK